MFGIVFGLVFGNSFLIYSESCFFLLFSLKHLVFGIVFGLVFGCLPNKDLYVLVYIVKTGGYKHSVRNSVRASVRKIISLLKKHSFIFF